jgi:hypothetical protein
MACLTTRPKKFIFDKRFVYDMPYRITSPVSTVSTWNPAPVSQPEPAGDTVDAIKIIVMQIIATMIT